MENSFDVYAMMGRLTFLDTWISSIEGEREFMHRAQFTMVSSSRSIGLSLH